MSLPKQVIDAEKRAEDLSKPAPVEDTTKQPAEKDQLAEPKDALSPDDLKAQLEDLQARLDAMTHKYSVLQGKYNTEIKDVQDPKLVSALKSENKSLRQQLTQLTASYEENSRILADIQEGLKKPKEPAVEQQEELDPTKVLTPDELEHLEREELSGETLKILSKLISASTRKAPPEQNDSKFDEIRKQVENIDRKIETNTQQSFEEKLRVAIPNWDNYVGDNADPQFATWLDQKISPISRRTNRDELQESVNKKDIPAIVIGVTEFEKSVKGVEDKPKPHKNPLERQIEPSESQDRESPPANANDRRYKLADQRKFYLDWTKGVYRGREKEAAALDKEYVRANLEGRIDP